MKFLIIGLGSLGKRRIRNLKYLQSGSIIGYDPRLDRRDEASQRYRIQTFENFSLAMAQDPEALFISTPSDLQIHYALEAAKADKHFFAEANGVNEQMTELIALLRKKNRSGSKRIVAAPSCTMRFYPGPKKIRKLLEEKAIGQPLTFTYHSGRYLLDCPLGEDGKTSSVSKQTNTCREIIPSELAWLSNLFGSIELISSFQGKVNNLEPGINDVCHLLLKFESEIIGHLLVDVVSKAPIRHMRIVASKGNIEWDNNEKAVKVYSGDNRLWRTESLIHGCVENMYINPEEPYIDEMRCFLEAIHGIAPFPYTFEEHLKILNLLDQAKESAKRSVHIQMNEKNLQLCRN